MVRVLVIGSNGAGKSTFSYHLAKKTGLPLIHLDQIHWHGSWERRPAEEFEAIVLSEAQKPCWIIDGNNVKSLYQRIPFADTVFWFEFSPIVCFFNILKRVCMHHGKVRPDMPDQCIEKLSFKFFHYAWNFNRSNRQRITSLLSKNHQLVVIRFTNRRQANKYLADI